METRILGRTGLVVTRIGLGLAALGRPGYINLKHGEDLQYEYSVDAMQAHTHSILDVAWQAGIRYFDVARSYGRAEVFLDSWLTRREISPKAVTVGSKWGYTYTADWQVDALVHETKELSLPMLRRQWAESDANLNRYLKLYQIHSATIDSGIFENTEVLQELDSYHQAGLAIGLSLSGPRQAETLERAMECQLDGRPIFECVQATWNLVETSAGEALRVAHESGLGVIVKEALANGRLTVKNDDQAFASRRALLEAAAKELDTSLDAFCLAAVLAHPWADVVLSGAATAEQLTSNMKALNISWDPSLDEKLVSLREPPEDYWTTRSNLPWI